MKIKEKIVFILISICLCIVVLSASVAAYTIATKEELKVIITNNWVEIIIIGILIIIAFYYALSIIYKKKLLKLQNESIYVKNTPVDFPVALAAILVGEDLDIRDFLKATISSLVVKKYLDIDENNQVITCQDKDLSKLKEHEKYIYSCIEKGYYINKNEYTNLVMNDIEKMELLHEGISNVDVQKRVLVAGIVVIVVLFLELFLRRRATILLLSVISLLAIWIVFQISRYQKKKYNRDLYHKTEKGELEAYRFMGLKKFIMKFDFNVNKKVFAMNKFENMIPYAIVFNEVFNMRDYIDSTKYRMIIDESLRNFNVEE